MRESAVSQLHTAPANQIAWRWLATAFTLIVFQCVLGTFVIGQDMALEPSSPIQNKEMDRIRPYERNPYYWQYKGKPVLLLGGSWQDNLFNHPTRLAEHLDLLVSVGGNYVRNTMSHRDPGNIFAFAQDDQGRFNLDEFNEPYWRRFERFLRLTHDRDIIVQIEIWDPHDHYLDRGTHGGWSRHPFNPRNNLNYTNEESGLPVEVDYHVTPWPSYHPFFRTVPALDNNQRVLAYQVAYVDRLLSHSLKYPHVLYCMNNEIGEETPWGDFWAAHVQQRAREAGVTVYTADMRRDHNIRTADHHHIYDHPDLYSFLDISQVTGRSGQRHYDDILYVREYIASHPRPINNVKNYGAFKGSEDECVARFYRMIFAGGASTRFHRPVVEDPDEHEAAARYGLGLSPRAQTTIKAMREVERAFDIFRSAPRNDLLSDREDNEAYLLAIPGEQYALYFPASGSVKLDLSAVSGEMVMRWLDLETAEWCREITAHDGNAITVTSPGPSSVFRDDDSLKNVVVNGSFESPRAITEPPGYTTSIPGWTLCSNFGHILNRASGPFYTYALGPIPEGDQVYGKQGAGVLSQRIRVLQHGLPFSLSFQVNCREGNDGMDLTVKLGRHILWNGTITTRLGEFHSITYEGVYDSDWGNTLSFEFTNPRGDATLLLDDVHLWTVPGCGEHCVVVITTK